MVVVVVSRGSVDMSLMMLVIRFRDSCGLLVNLLGLECLAVGLLGTMVNSQRQAAKRTNGFNVGQPMWGHSDPSAII